MISVRRGEADDIQAIGGIQAASPQASQWDPAEYLLYDLRVAVRDGGVCGFLVSRTLAPGECEVLNVAVAPGFRRQGVGRILLAALIEGYAGVVYLEVRESNQAAREFYKSQGFVEVTVRPDYYQTPMETAIVLKFHSC